MTIDVQSDNAVVRRIRFFAAVNSVMLLAGVVVALVLVVNSQETLAALAGLLPALAGCGAMLVVRTPRILKRMAFGYIVFLILFLGLIDIVSGTLSGAMWTALLIWPAITLLTLQDLRLFAIAVVLDLAVFLTSSLLMLNQIVPIIFLRPEADLQTIWLIDLMVFSIMTIMLALIGRDEKASRQLAIRILDQQHQAEQELASAYAEAQSVNARLQHTRNRQQLLREQARALQVPLIQLSPTLALLPLVGRIDAMRIANLRQSLPLLLHNGRIATVIIDITGASLDDVELINDFDELIRVVLLLGCTPVLSGVSADIAAMIAGVDNATMQHYTERLERVIAADFAEHGSASEVYA